MNVKIIASLGPSSRSYDIVKEMTLYGASGFRINFTHGDREFWSQLVRAVREAEKTLGKALTLITDLKGASVRLGRFPEPLTLKAGDTIKFSINKYSAQDKVVPLPNIKVVESLEEGDTIVMDDGRVWLRVTKTRGSEVEAVALTDAIIKPEKGLVVKDKEFDLPSISDKDLRDLEFACSVSADYIGLSYVRSAHDIYALKDHLRRLRCDAKIIAKVETRSAVENLNPIVEASDAVLVARGDLGMNFGLEEIPSLQTKIVNASVRKGKPVIIATQLLESMINNPIPTRAEVVDVHNAVREGVDALMLTGETAAGKYPVEAVKWLKKIALAAESGWEPKIERVGGPIKRRYAKGITELAEDLNAKLIIYSMKGNTVNFVSSVRPRIPFYAGVPNIRVARSINILWGVVPVIVNANDYMKGLEKTYEKLKGEGAIKFGDISVLTYGLRENEQLIKIMRLV